MEYLETQYPQKTTRRCHRCGSFLLLVGVTVEKDPNQEHPITTSTYHCSDADCQKNAERDLARIVKKRKEQELASEERKIQRTKKAPVATT